MSFGAGSAIPVGVVTAQVGGVPPHLVNTTLPLDVTPPPTTGATVSPVTNTGGPITSASITSGNSASNYAITSAGVIIIGLNGNANLRTTGTDVLTVIASNVNGGSAPVTVTINRLQAPVLAATSTFSATVGATAPATLGTVANTGGVPSTEVLTGTNSANYAITTGGVVTTTVSPATVGSDNLTATATNASGQSTSAVTINRVSANVAPVITDNIFNLSIVPPTGYSGWGTVQSSQGTNITYSITQENGGAPTGRYTITPTTGILSVTAAGSAALTTEGTDILIVTATNSVGQDTASNTVRKWLDGFQTRPVVTAAQYPTFLNGLCRPPWKVAGVDYGVGFPSSQAFKTPGVTAPPAGVTVNAGAHTFTVTGAGVVVDGWDFSVGGGWTLFVNGSGCTVQNSKFLTGANARDCCVISGANAILQYCVLDGAGLNPSGGPDPSGPTVVNCGALNTIIRHCWIRRGWWDLVDLHGQGTGATSNYTLRFNLLENSGQEPSQLAHPDWVQTYSTGGDPGYNIITVEYNTTRQTPPIGGGSGTQGYTLNLNSNQPTVGIGTINFNNNTSVDTSNAMNYFMAYDLGETRGVVNINNNYALVPENLGTEAFKRFTVPGALNAGIVTGSGNTKINGAACSTPANWNFGAISPPTLSVQNFNLALPAFANQAIGTLNFTGGTPTSWTFVVTPASAQNFFEIPTNANGTGTLKVAAGYTTGITAQTYAFAIKATNGGGDSNTVTDNVVASQAAPVVSAQTVTMQLPVTASTGPGTGTTVLQGSATNSPTAASWALSAFIPASAASWFGVETTTGTPGRVFVTSAGVTALGNTTQTIKFNLSASNAGGPGTAQQTVNVQAAQAPTISSQNFTLSLPTSANTVIGTTNFSNGKPTSWAINSVTPGSATAFFAPMTTNANGTGVLKVASNYTTGLTAQTYQIALHAANAVGNSNTVTDNVVASGAAPVLTPQTMSINLPKMQNDTVGTPVQATNNPTPSSWQISNVVPASAGTWFSIDTAGPTPGQVRVTTAGANGLDDTTQSISFVVTASNASGPGSAQMTVNAVSSTINDGSQNAPFPGMGNGQYPNWFNSVNDGPTPTIGGKTNHLPYRIRPSWNVAGVDYYVGHPTNITLKDPLAPVANGGISTDNTAPVYRNFDFGATGNIFVQGSNVTLDGYDFTGKGVNPNFTVKILPAATGTTTIKNSWMRQANNPPGAANMIFSDNQNCDLLVQNCTMDYNYQGNNPAGESNQTQLGAINNHSITFEYCWIKNSLGDFLDYQGGVQRWFIRYNLWENGGLEPDSHADWVGLQGGIINPFVIEFTTIIQNATNSAGSLGVTWGCGCYNNVTSQNVRITGSFHHNVVGPCISQGEIVMAQSNGNSQTDFSNCFIDPSPGGNLALSDFYIFATGRADLLCGTCTGARTQSNNINLLTGKVLTQAQMETKCKDLPQPNPYGVP